MDRGYEEAERSAVKLLFYLCLRSTCDECSQHRPLSYAFIGLRIEKVAKEGETMSREIIPAVPPAEEPGDSTQQNAACGGDAKRQASARAPNASTLSHA